MTDSQFNTIYWLLIIIITGIGATVGTLMRIADLLK
jgi:hypothetical protein